MDGQEVVGRLNARVSSLHAEVVHGAGKQTSPNRWCLYHSFAGVVLTASGLSSI
jgi:hypothetical protein